MKNKLKNDFLIFEQLLIKFKENMEKFPRVMLFPS